MKKVFVVFLAVLMVFTFASCGGKTENAEPATDAGNTEEAAPDATEAPDADAQSVSESGAQAEAALIPGELYQLEGTDTPALRGLRLSGNRSGTAEFNAAEVSDKGIRCIFELNEWVEVTPDTDAEEGLAVWAFSHREDPEAYQSETLSEETPGFAAYCDLPLDAEAEEGAPRGSFYLNPDECEPGYYDLVFTLNGNATAVLLTRFYNEGELEEKSDPELTELMNGLN